MTMPNPMQFIDPNNPLLATGQARLDLGTINIPGAGEFGVVTVRTASATQTVMLAAKDVAEWAKSLTGLSEAMGGSKLQVATAMDVAALDTTMQRNTR